MRRKSQRQTGGIPIPHRSRAQLHSGRLIEERREAGKLDEAQMGLPAAARVPPENASLTQDLQNGVAQQCGRW